MVDTKVVMKLGEWKLNEQNGSGGRKQWEAIPVLATLP